MGRRLPVGGCRFFGAQKIFQYFLSGRTVPWYGADWTLCVQAQNHGAVSGRENAAVAAFSRPACAAPLSEWRGALHCMQIVWTRVSGARKYDRDGTTRSQPPPHDALRHRFDQMYL